MEPFQGSRAFLGRHPGYSGFAGKPWALVCNRFAVEPFRSAKLFSEFGTDLEKRA